mmetsp:Transcript_29645/g.39421  ORF Transcript_29645/g.39421 Transcript_29645/m.39421 type:complete len:224 (+) Transcript_29645:322-993(+)
MYKDNAGAEQNVCLELLDVDENDNASECEPKNEDEHIADFFKNKELTKPDAECENIIELQKLYAMRDEEQSRIDKKAETKRVSRDLKAGFRKKAKQVDLDKPLNMTEYLNIVRSVTQKKSMIAEAMLAKVKDFAMKHGHSEIISKINQSYAIKLREEAKKQARPHTVLRSDQVHVDVRPNFDSDKNYFLNELMKLLAYGEHYFRLKHYTQMYNAGLTIAFICI